MTSKKYFNKSGNDEHQLEKKRIKAINHHLSNISKLAKNPTRKEMEKMYSYLDNCWICGKKLKFWDYITFNIIHTFEGNSHRRNCQ